MAPQPACDEMQRLLEDFARTVSERHRMEAAQVTAVLNGADFPFEEWISNATERVKQARLAIITHRLQHGC
jgi:hypothetical protein